MNTFLLVLFIISIFIHDFVDANTKNVMSGTAFPGLDEILTLPCKGELTRFWPQLV